MMSSYTFFDKVEIRSEY